MTAGLMSFGYTLNAIKTGWNTLGLGDGGYVLGMNLPAGGASAGGVCKTDVSGGYFWTGTTWRQVCSPGAIGSASGPVDSGVWEIVIAPSDPTRLYMVFGDPAGGTGTYAVWVSSDSGVSWTKTALTFTTYQNPLVSNLGYVIANGGGSRLTNQKAAVDPGNPDVCYVGMPYGTTMTGTHSADAPGCFVTLDGGTTWTLVSGTPTAWLQPGYAGMVIDSNSTPTTLGGQTVKSRIFLPCGGQGIWQSTDGGNSFTKIASDPTPSTTATITTAAANEIIVVQVMCYGEGLPINYKVDGGGAVTNTGTASLTWKYRGGPSPQTYGWGRTFEYYAIAASAGTYNISVNYIDGCISYIKGAVATSCTAGTVSNSGGTGGAVLTVDGTVTGTFAVGQMVNCGNSGYIPITGLLTGSGGTGTYQLGAYLTLNISSSTINAYAPISNQVNIFAVADVDTTSPFAIAAPHQGGYQYQGGSYSVTTTGTALLCSFGYSATTSTDSGFALMGQNANYTFWSEISSAAASAGAYTFLYLTGFYITDALAQSSGGTITFDNYVFAQSGPSAGLQPVDITTAQMDHAGTYWAINGPSPKAAGSVWRNISGTTTWNRIDGSLVGSAATMTYQGYIGANSSGNAACVDPRSGYEGRVIITGPNSGQHGYSTTTGNAAWGSIGWSSNAGGTQTQTITSNIGWLNGGTSTAANIGAHIGDMVVDPVTGYYWQAGGNGIMAYSAWVLGGPFVAVNYSDGIEEMLVGDILAPPGGALTLVGVEDEMVLNTDLILPGASNSWHTHDSDCWQLDYASDNPAYIASIVTGLGGAYSGWSNNYGQPGSWTQFTNLPGPNNLGGCIAAASYTDSTHANLVCINGTNTQPVYTKDNGDTAWIACTGLPSQSYIVTKELCTRLIAADRVNIGTFGVYVPGTSGTSGFCLSTDGGATFTRQALGPNLGSIGANCGYTLLSAPGFADSWWLVGNIWNNGALQLNYSHGTSGVTWNQVSGVSALRFMALGKAPSPGAYPTVFVLATIGGIAGFYRGICNGSDPSAGFTWTQFGDLSTSIPSTSYAAGPSQIWGDWNVFGRMYVGWGQNGALFYNP